MRSRRNKKSSGREQGIVYEGKWVSGGWGGQNQNHSRGEVVERRRAKREIEGGDLERLRE